MSTAAVYQSIAALGVQDLLLVATSLEEAATTFWRQNTMKYTPFALEMVEITPETTVAFGASRVTYTLPRQGDGVWSLFAMITIPGIWAADTSTPNVDLETTNAPHWVDAVGQYLIQEADLELGGTRVDRMDSIYLYAWEELSGKPGKRLGEMIGKSAYSDAPTQTIVHDEGILKARSRRTQKLYVPLPFFHTYSTGSTLPLAAMSFHAAKIKLTFRNSADCIVKGAATTDLVYSRGPSNPANDSLGATYANAVADSELECNLLAYYVYFDSPERTRVAGGRYQMIIHQTQIMSSTQATAANSTSAATTEATAPITTVNYDLNFNNVVSELIFMMRRGDMLTNSLYGKWNLFYGFASPDQDSYPVFHDGITDVLLKFNNADRQTKLDGDFYRKVAPYVHHSYVPKGPGGFIYCFPFAVDPEDAHATGGVNFSRIDNVQLQLGIHANVFNGNATLRGVKTGESATTHTTADVFCYARNYNHIKFQLGLAGVSFA